jgi:hydrogenase/urease accessory protein HupE
VARLGKLHVAAVVTVAGVLGLFAGGAGATEVVYNPATPQATFGGLITSNYIIFIGLAIALATASVAILLARMGLDGAWSALRGAGKAAKKGRR